MWLMRQAGRYLPEYRVLRSKCGSFLEFCYSPELAVEATLQPLARYAMDGAILFSDILVIPDALGQAVRFEEGTGPVLEPVRTRADVEKLQAERMREHLAPVFETLARLSQNLPAEVALIGFAGSPWTVATYMVEGRGGTNHAVVRKWALTAPQEFEKLIDLLVEVTVAYLIEQVRNGAEVLQLFDSWAGVLAETQFRRWVIGPTSTIVQRLHASCPGVPVIGFPRGAGVLYKDFVDKTGVDGISIDSTVPVSWAGEHLQGRCTVQGNLDNLALLGGGPMLEEETRRILDGLGRGPFIFNLGHGVLQETPPENVSRLTEIVRAWGGG